MRGKHITSVQTLLLKGCDLFATYRNGSNHTYFFDATVIYRSCLFDPDPLETFVARSDDDPTQIRITIRLVGNVMLGDAHYIQGFNILTRNAFRNLNLNLVNTDHRNPKTKVTINERHLELWSKHPTTI
jgi:hypothetical protein